MAAKRKTKKKDVDSVTQVTDLVDKQVHSLERASRTLTKLLSDTDKKVLEAQNVLLELRYKIKEKTEALEVLELNRTQEIEDKCNKSEEQYNKLIEDKESELDLLSKNYETKLKDFKVNLDIDRKGYEKEVLEMLLEQFKKADISLEEVEKLKSAEESLKAKFTKKEKAIVSSLNSKHENEISKLKLTNEKEQASNEAKIENLESRIDFLNSELAKADKRIQTILDNQVRVAEHTKAITVNNEKD